jgi:hypothetical protein
MKFENLKKLSGKQFRRVTGVKQKTFEVMVGILEKAHKEKHARGGRPNNLTVPNMLLMALEYLREYRTYASYGLAESSAFDTIRWVENTLIKSGVFRLAGTKSLSQNPAIETVLIDVTESPIERPKKTTLLLFWKKETSHP